jgi:hypothetical protein
MICDTDFNSLTELDQKIGSADTIVMTYKALRKYHSFLFKFGKEDPQISDFKGKIIITK